MTNGLHRLLGLRTDRREVRKEVNAALEEARRNKQIGSSVEAAVTVEAVPVTEPSPQD